MKKILHKVFTMVALCGILLSTTTAAQEIVKVPKTLNCAELKWLFAVLSKDYGESSVFNGVDANGRNRYIMTLNSKTGSWTMIEYEGTFGCVLGTGDAAQFNLGNLLKGGTKL